MKLKKTFPPLLSAILLMTGCASNGEEPELNIDSPTAPTEKIISLVEDFHKSLGNSESRAGDLVIDDIHSDFYCALSGNEAIPINERTRAVEDSTIFDISTVTFHIGEDKGYALLSAHEKINRIFFYTPKGELKDTTENIILRDVFANAPNIGASLYSASDGGDGDGHGGGDGGGGDDDSEQPDMGEGGNGEPGGDGGISIPSYTYGPLLKTDWNQGYPYNLFVKPCECKDCKVSPYSGHNPVGCVALATAQFIVHFEKFNGVFYQNRNIDFTKFKETPTAILSPYKTEIAYFVREVALGCQIQFGCDGSSSNPKAAWHYLLDIGYDVEYHTGSLDNNVAKSCLSKGWPLILSGMTTKFLGIFHDKGHTWILDGIKSYLGKTQYHCVWGFCSESDGWLDSSFTTGDGERRYSASQNQIYVKSFNN